MSGFIETLRIGMWGHGAPRPGDRAPRFALTDQDGRIQELEQFRGRWLVLYFYPKDGTPVCTREACNFRDDQQALRKLGAEVLGVSTDSSADHRSFAVRYALTFPLLSDPDGALSRAYGSLFQLGPIRFSRRRTFLIGPDGRIARVYRRVNAADHSAEVLRDLGALQQTGRP